MFPSVEASEVGATGLGWLFVSYGYVLYFASNLISEGSDLLLLVPSMAGLVGGVVLPLLGAVPDGAIMLFSGLGDMAHAQETLSVGVGALAGSTIMLLTVPWAMSIFGGRVDLNSEGVPNYLGKPKLTENLSTRDTLLRTGVAVTQEVTHGGIIMMITTIPYFMIQIPASFLHGPSEEVAEGEKYWALAGLIVCLIGFFSYLYVQLRISAKGMDRLKRVAVMKKQLQKGAVSLAGALSEDLKKKERRNGGATTPYYQAIEATDGVDGRADERPLVPSKEVRDYLKEVLWESFVRYDQNKNGSLDRKEMRMFFRDFHESISDDDMDELMAMYDKNHDGTVSFDEFIGACYNIIKSHDEKADASTRSAHEEMVSFMFREEEEQEEVPEDISHLSPEEQQAAIKKRAFTMLSIGTLLVVVFSDPMVDVMQQIAVRLGLSPFYVSFILAPLASNASEVIASQYYAAKKTRKTIAVSLTALEGAASMMNTFCLSIFMGLIYFRGLAWQYTAETIAILAVEFIMGILVQRQTLTTLTGCLVLSIFPLSLVLVATLEALGFD